MKSKLLLALITISLSFNSIVAYASPTDIRHIDDVYNKMDSIESKIQKYDSNIEEVLLQIGDNNKHINEVQSKIQNKKNKIKKIQKDINKEQSVLNDRMKILYMNNVFSNQYLSFILSSENLSDLMHRIHISEFLMDYDKKIIDVKKNSQNKIKNIKEELEKSKKNILKIKTINENKMKSIEKERKEQQNLLCKIQDSQINSQIGFAPKSILQNINSRARETRPSRGGHIGTKFLVSYSTRFLGVPYLWGGTTPNGFDCSGFVQYVYAHGGISIPRVAKDQQNHGYAVSQLRPGDLLFYGKSAHHVTMYVGDGYMIEAPHTGSFVKITPVRSYTNARRIIR